MPAAVCPRRISCGGRAPSRIARGSGLAEGSENIGCWSRRAHVSGAARHTAAYVGGSLFAAGAGFGVDCLAAEQQRTAGRRTARACPHAIERQFEEVCILLLPLPGNEGSGKCVEGGSGTGCG